MSMKKLFAFIAISSVLSMYCGGDDEAKIAEGAKAAGRVTVKKIKEGGNWLLRGSKELATRLTSTDTHYCICGDNSISSIAVNCKSECANSGKWSGDAEVTDKGVKCYCGQASDAANRDASKDREVSCSKNSPRCTGNKGWSGQVVVVAPPGQKNTIIDKDSE